MPGCRRQNNDGSADTDQTLRLAPRCIGYKVQIWAQRLFLPFLRAWALVCLRGTSRSSPDDRSYLSSRSFRVLYGGSVLPRFHPARCGHVRRIGST